MNCDHPFIGTYRKFFHKGEGRFRISINNSKLYMNYSRYLMCVKEGRILKEEEQVHHIDEDKTNDDIDNLKILSAYEHGKIHHLQKEFIELICINCNKKFMRDLSEHKTSVKRNAKTFCSHSCNTKFGNFSKTMFPVLSIGTR